MVVIYFATLPGGALKDFNFGKTLTHEVGHWLGLYYAFEENSCLGDGDYVGDTPPEAQETRGCPANKVTCVGGGTDPVRKWSTFCCFRANYPKKQWIMTLGLLPDNFMDYADDQCMTEFTAGQIERMHWFVQNYRQPTTTTNYTFPYSSLSMIPW